MRLRIDPARAVRIALITAVVLGVAVDAFFAIVNFYPVAPHASRGPKRYVVMQLDPVQAAWFQANVLDDFNDEANANLQLLRVDDEEQLQAATAAAAKRGDDPVLVLLTTTQVDHARSTGLVQPFTAVASASQIAADFGGLGDAAIAPTKVGGQPYYLPGVARLDVAVYRISKVRDAVLHWSVLRPEIDAALRRVNGRGLPAGYELSLSPEAWDSYDVFVMAYYWANRVYGGQPARPRIAHRTGDEIDGQRDIAAALYRMGGDDKTFLRTDARPAVDYFQWEALMHAEGLYPEAMYADDPYDDEAMMAGLEKGELFLGSLDAMEAFSLHGGAHVGAQPQTDDAADLGFTMLPRGASLALDAKGQPARRGATFSFREDWVWALPTTASGAGADDAYRLVQFLWRPGIHARICEALGTLPVHPEVVAARASYFRLDWMRHVFEAGFDQARRGEPEPAALVGKGLGSVYAQLWTKIVAGRMAPAPDGAIAAVLHAPPPPKALQVAAVGAGSGSAAPDDHAAASEPDVAPAEPPETEDWETDVVLAPRDGGVAPDAAAGGGR
jgi:hypothetical protein